MRDIAVISGAAIHEELAERDEVELIHAVVSQALAGAGPAADRIGFVCSGSCDMLIGRPFSFVQGLDGIAAWPPIRESHVEMDGAWALYEAWTRLQLGDIDAALVYGFGRASAGSLKDVSVLQLDPYTLAPLWPDSDVLAGLQVSAMQNSGRFGDMPSVSPLPVTDGAAAVVLAAGDLVRQCCDRPAWIEAIDHRIEPAELGVRNLATSRSTRVCVKAMDVAWDTIDCAALHTRYEHERLLLMETVLEEGAASILPATNTPMVTGLSNIAEIAERITDGRSDRGVAHATSGPCLQQNLLCVLAADDYEGAA